ncbi:MAG: DUF4976 domain-containing protein [Puniceicoccaceae bacterium]|nr:MAG: DUF4976 domain-containing protein [Puniceicoccaceae bacterium]
MAATPNILIFMTDQQRGDSVSPGSAGKAVTLRLDAFREEAVAFDHAYCPAPHCCPSRASFFTGLYPSEHGVWNNVCVQNALSTGPRAAVRQWSEVFAAAGYDLSFCGKWHVSREQGPADFGWREGMVTAGTRAHGQGVMGPTWESYANLVEEDRPRREGEISRPGYGSTTLYGVHQQPFNDVTVVEAGIECLSAAAKNGKPWLHFIGTLGPHDPYQAPQWALDCYDPVAIELPSSFGDAMEDKPGLYRRMRERFATLAPEEHRAALHHYLAACTYQDHLFGRLLDALEETGQRENTLVLYCSDHGDYAGEHGLWAKGLPAFESCYHVPALVRWPAGLKAPGRTVADFVDLVDFGPTFLEAAGLEIPEALSGRSLQPFLRGERPEDWRTAHCRQTNGNELYGIQRSIRTAEWKYVFNGFDFDELYHLEDDPGETRNLARDPAHRGTVEALCAEMWRFARDHGDACINNYITVALAPVGPGAAFRQAGDGPS